jgi:hypothetical protein
MMDLNTIQFGGEVITFAVAIASFLAGHIKNKAVAEKVQAVLQEVKLHSGQVVQVGAEAVKEVKKVVQDVAKAPGEALAHPVQFIEKEAAGDNLDVLDMMAFKAITAMQKRVDALTPADMTAIAKWIRSEIPASLQSFATDDRIKFALELAQKEADRVANTELFKAAALLNAEQQPAPQPAPPAPVLNRTHEEALAQAQAQAEQAPVVEAPPAQ